MATSPSPWSVKGVDPEAREAAKIAARKAGLTVGAWLNQMIRQSASDQLRGSGSAQPGGGAPGYGQQNRPDHPANQRAQNERYFSGNEGWDTPPQQPGYQPGYGAHPTPQPGMSPPPAPTIQAVFESIQRLSSRIEQAEKRTSDTIAPIVEKIAELGEQLEKTKNSGGTSTAPVERAVQKIADRLDKMESGSSPSGLSAERPVREERPQNRKGLLGLFRKP
jgi:localization factor PodJL